MRECIEPKASRKVLFKDLEVCEMLAIGRSTLWKKCRTGTFPKPIRVRPDIPRWHRDDIDGFLQAAMEARDADR